RWRWRRWWKLNGVPRAAARAVAGQHADRRARRQARRQLLSDGQRRQLDLAQNGAPNALTRTVVSGPDANGLITVNETALGQSVNTQYRKDAQGIWSVDPIGDVAPPSVRQFVGDLLEIPEPFFAPGAVLESIRQGSWGVDLGGDGHPEGYRLEYRRQLVGFETLALPRGSAETAHLRTVIVFTLTPSSLAQSELSSTATEDTWWAPGIGLVRAERRFEGDGAEPPITLTIVGATVAGQPLFVDPPDGTLTKLSLVHNDLVYDTARQRYYASIPGSATGVGNSIATIDPATGAISYSTAIGSEPFALGLAPDGGALYVGLNGSGEVARLSLPSLAETGRVRLPSDSIFHTQMFAENIAVSPSDASVVAVSMWRPNLSPRHGGVVLLRSLVVQPVKTQERRAALGRRRRRHFRHAVDSEVRGRSATSAADDDRAGADGAGRTAHGQHVLELVGQRHLAVQLAFAAVARR
ncbi:MAG TPA: hypothetical protein VFU71_01630, partial [Burkholderiaceae bacterium]|nr:hypothetical protein [Burkholderiaceae bacterium]